MVQIFDSNSRSIKTVSNCMRGKTCGVLAAIEAFLFNRRDQTAIFNNGSCRITVIRIDTQDIQCLIPNHPCNLWLNINSAMAR